MIAVQRRLPRGRVELFTRSVIGRSVSYLEPLDDRISRGPVDRYGGDMTIQQELDECVAGETVATRFLNTVAHHGDIAVLRWKESDGTWAERTLQEVADDTARLVTALRELGIGKGDRVVLMMSNRPEFHAIDLAVLFCGATPVSIYNSSAPDQIEYLVNHCGAKLAIVENDTFVERFDAVRDRLGTLENTIVIEPSADTDPAHIRYGELLTREPADLAAAAEVGEPGDLATVIYTSGTTGPPKGVMLTNYNIVWSLESISRSMRAQTDLEALAGFRHVSYLPMAHIMERLLGHYYLVEFATQVTCCPETSKVAAYAAEVHPHFFIGVPRVWEKLHAGVTAAMAADPEKAKAFEEGLAAAEPIAAKMRAGTATDEEIDTYEFLDAVAFTPGEAVDRSRRGQDLHQWCRTTPIGRHALVPDDRRAAQRGLRNVGDDRHPHLVTRREARPRRSTGRPASR